MIKIHRPQSSRTKTMSTHRILISLKKWETPMRIYLLFPLFTFRATFPNLVQHSPIYNFITSLLSLSSIKCVANQGLLPCSF